MNHVVIIGFMGSGKTRVGKQLAKDLELPFVDLDRLITKKMNLSLLQSTGDSGSQAADSGSGKKSNLTGSRTSFTGTE